MRGQPPSRLSQGEVFIRLMRMLEKQGIRYCLLGETSGFPDEIQSDVDVMIEVASEHELYRILEQFCREESLFLIQMIQHERCAWHCSVAWQNGGGLFESLQLDFCSDYVRRGRHFLSHQSLLDRRIPAHDQQSTPRGFYILSPQDEFIYYLLKRVDKLSLDRKQGRHLSTQWRNSPAEGRRQLERFWPPEFAVKLALAAEGDLWENIIVNLPQVRSSLHRKNRLRIGDHVKRWRFLFHRFLHPPGLSLCVQGGRSTTRTMTAGAVEALLQPCFFHQERFSDATVPLRPRQNAEIGGTAPLKNRAQMFMDLSGLLQRCSLRWGRNRIRLARAALIPLDSCPAGVPRGTGQNKKSGPTVGRGWWERIIPHPDVCVLLKDGLDDNSGDRSSITPTIRVPPEESIALPRPGSPDVFTGDTSVPIEDLQARCAIISSNTWPVG